MKELEVMSTRLFPKGLGADQYRVTGIAARCDWVLLTDPRAPESQLRGNLDIQPRTVFLSMRACFRALNYFFDEVLPKISGQFVLITGSEDTTVPNQIDRRWREFNSHEKRCIHALLEDSRLVHWYAENLDEAHPKMSPLPLGLFPAEDDSHQCVVIPDLPALESRKMAVFCCHRIRDGEQWEERRRVSELCKLHFKAFCNLVEEPLPELEFVRQMESHVFVLCAPGGGIDPSPKAWQAILHGAIPIIRSSPLDDAYRKLPVAIVEDWTPGALSEDRLEFWLSQLRNFYEDYDRRRLVLNKLSLDYWWSKILLTRSRATRQVADAN